MVYGIPSTMIRSANLAMKEAGDAVAPPSLVRKQINTCGVHDEHVYSVSSAIEKKFHRPETVVKGAEYITPLSSSTKYHVVAEK